MEIGELQRVIVIEPLELPIGTPNRNPESEPTVSEPAPQPEKMPIAP